MQTLVIPIQGQLPQLLNASRDDTAWIVTITLLVSAICTPISGRFGDMFGKRKVTLCLLGLLVGGSVVAALSSSVGGVIVGRALQGAGLGVIPLGISILRDAIPASRLGSAIAFVSATLGVGGALGLPVSALVAEHADWHALFWIAGALGIIALILILLWVPADGAGVGGRVDVVGVIGLAVGLTAILVALSQGNRWGWASVGTLGLLAAGLLLLVIWGWVELRVRDPLVDLRTSSRGAVLFVNLASLGMGFALFTSNVAFPQLLQLPEAAGGLGLALLPASLVIMPSGLAMLVISPVAGRLERRFGAKPLLVASGLILALTYLLSAMLPGAVWQIVVLNVVLGVGIGLGFAAVPTIILQSVPPSESGSANGLNTLMRSLGIAIASALVSVVLAQSARVIDGASVPSLEGFRAAFLCAVVAAVICTVFALYVRTPRPTR